MMNYEVDDQTRAAHAEWFGDARESSVPDEKAERHTAALELEVGSEAKEENR